MEDHMNESILQHYLETSIYTYVGAYKDFVLSLPDDIPSIGMLVCGQITHPSMYFTEPSPYLEETYFGKFSSYPKHRFKNEDELYITAVSMIAGILRLDETGFTKNRDVTKRITVSRSICAAGYYPCARVNCVNSILWRNCWQNRIKIWSGSDIFGIQTKNGQF